MLIKKVLLCFSTVSCTRCVTTGLAKCTQSRVRQSPQLAYSSTIAYSGKPSGYDRVRNAEIGNKVSDSLVVLVIYLHDI